MSAETMRKLFGPDSSDESDAQESAPLSLRKQKHKKRKEVDTGLFSMPKGMLGPVDDAPVVPKRSKRVMHDDYSSEEDEPLTKRIKPFRPGSLLAAPPKDPRQNAQERFQIHGKHMLDNANAIGIEALGVTSIKTVLAKGLFFDGGLKRRGHFSYPCTKTPRTDTRAVRYNREIGDISRAKITLSSKLIDGGCPDQELDLLLLHELSHAACPGHKHDAVWKAICLKAGGDGKRCDSSETTSRIIDFKYLWHCAAAGPRKAPKDTPKHMRHTWKTFHKMTKRLRTNNFQCSRCKSKLLVVSREQLNPDDVFGAPVSGDAGPSGASRKSKRLDSDDEDPMVKSVFDVKYDDSSDEDEDEGEDEEDHYEGTVDPDNVDPNMEICSSCDKYKMFCPCSTGEESGEESGDSEE